MSFILDALRKSESQRRLDAVPELMRVPVAVPRERLPTWAVAVIAALALALVAAIVVGWRSERAPVARAPRSDAPAAVAPASTEPTPATLERTGTALDASPAPVAATAPAPTATETSASVPAGADPTAARAAPLVPAASTAAPSPPPTTARRSIDTSTLPSPEALRAAGIAIPPLDLQLLVTSATPSSRLVVINGSRYREGERLREGPEVVEVVPEGAVLRLAGSEFLLVTD